MDITEQLLTPEQIKHGFSIEAQERGVTILNLKGKKIAFFQLKEATKETVQNVANTLWEAYTLGFQDGQRITRGDKLFDAIGKDII